MNGSQNIGVAEFSKGLKLANLLPFNKSINNTTLSFFTDGSCTGNGKISSVGGYAVICVSGYKKNNILYGKVDNHIVKATNIRAEATAILTILQYLVKHIKSTEWNAAVIYTDSEFWLKMLYNYMPKWSLNTFSTKANPDITNKMWTTWQKLLISDKKVEIIHVYAHNKTKGNTSSDPFTKFCHDYNKLADDLANIAREQNDYKLHHDIL